MHTLTCQIIVQQILLFYGEKNTYLHNLIRTYTFIDFWDFFLQNPIFTYINEKKSFLHGLIKTYTSYDGGMEKKPLSTFWELFRRNFYVVV